MDVRKVEELRKDIASKRVSYPFLSPYLKGSAAIAALKRNLRGNSQDDAMLYLLDQMERYRALSVDLLREQIGETPIDPNAVVEVIFGYDNYINDTQLDEDEYLSEHVAYYEKASAANALQPAPELFYLKLLLHSYMKSHYGWRGKKYAKRARILLTEVDAGYELVKSVADYYLSVCDLRAAYEIALEGANRLYEEGKRSEAAYLFGHAYGYVKDVPDIAMPAEADIKHRFEEDAEHVNEALRMHGLRHDPVEATDEFQAAYDGVMEEATAKYLASGAPIPHALWDYMEEGFSTRGIDWHSPQMMNRNTLFD